MKQIRVIMGMPITIEIISSNKSQKLTKTFKKAFNYFKYVDEKFSPFKKQSELSLINSKSIKKEDYSLDMKKVLTLCAKTKRETQGFFDIKKNDGTIDTSGLVKGWAILNASKIIKKDGFNNYFVDAGGDIQTSGFNKKGAKWKIGIKNPFNKNEIVKIVSVSGDGVATSGNYERGFHILNPKTKKQADEIASITVIAKNIYEADRFATAAFAMGESGIEFIEKQNDLEGYMIDKSGLATFTPGFEKYKA